MDPDGYEKQLWLWAGSLDGMSPKVLSDNAAFDYVDGLWGYFGLWSSKHHIRHVNSSGLQPCQRTCPPKATRNIKVSPMGIFVSRRRTPSQKRGRAGQCGFQKSHRDCAF